MNRRSQRGSLFAYWGFVLVLFGAASGVAHATVFVVDSAADTAGSTCTSPCTLRQAITANNATNGGNAIAFGFANSKFGVLIQPVTALPAITKSVTINGYSQPGTAANNDPSISNAVLKIRIDGLNAGANSSGLGICHDNVHIKGLSITRFGKNGINVGADASGNNCSFSGSPVDILGNFIGLATNGSTAAGNLGEGVFVRQGTVFVGASQTLNGVEFVDTFALADRNVIGANGANGILLSGVANAKVFGNLIGTDKTGTLDTGNIAAGVRLDGGTTAAIIGLTGSNGPNLIRYNAAGIATANDATIANNRWISNRIFGNDGLGIDLKNDGVTANDGNDADTGPNGVQNFPVINTGTHRILGGLHLSGQLDVPAAGGSFTLGVYASSACNSPALNGEGELFLGTKTVTLTDGLPGELIGSDFTTSVTIPPGSVITMTATGTGGSSEFSNCVPADAPPLVVNVTDDADPTGTCTVGHCSLRQAINSANFDAGVDVIAFNIPTPASGELLLQPSTPLPALVAPVTIDGYTQSGTSENTDPDVSNAVLRVRVDGAAAGGAANGISICSPGVTVRGLSVTGFGQSGIVVGLNCGGTPFSGTRIVGNFIGLATDGATAAGNAGAGVRIALQAQPPIPIPVSSSVGSSAAADRNVIAANLDGVSVEDVAEVLGTLIGTDKSGLLDRGNSGGGVNVTDSGFVARIGAAGAPNLIRFNGDGIRTGTQTVGDFWAYNRISSNDNLGIDLANDGVSTNDVDDPDSGPDKLQNFPEITKAERSAVGIRITGKLDVPAGTSNKPYLIAIYANATCDASGFGEGERLLGAATVNLTQTTGETFRFELITDDPLEPGVQITATASGQIVNSNGDTFYSDGSSEFSQCVAATDAPPGIVVTSAADPGTGGCTLAECTLREAITLANTQVGEDLIRFEIPGTGPFNIALSSLLPAITEALTIDGYTQAGSSPNAATSGSDAVLQIQLNGLGTRTNLLRTCTPDPVIVRGLSLISASGAAIATQSNDAANCAAVGSLTLAGSYVGIRADGTPFSNTAGILVTNTVATIGTGVLADRNIISNSATFGVRIIGANSAGSTVQNNLIGTTADPSVSLGNLGAGVEINGASNVTVGGSGILANVIRANAQGAVVLGNATGVRLAGNEYGANTGLAIDLSTGAAANGVTANDLNDADSGPNNLQNFPLLTGGNAGSGSFKVNGSLDVPSAAPSAPYEIAIYESSACDAAGHGEGEVLLDSQTVFVSGAAQGFSVVVPVDAPAPGHVITATATDANGNTSEFSACLTTLTSDTIFANNFE